MSSSSAFKENGITNDYQPSFGIRLDSGDLAYLSQKCREILDANGLSGCKILATNGLDEYLIADLERQGAKIDSYGVGDSIATSKEAPCFGGVYKLVQIDDMPVLKRSEDQIKLINPGFQITYRLLVDGKNEVDITCLRGDKMEKDILAGRIVSRDSFLSRVIREGSYTARQMQLQMISNGSDVHEKHSLIDKKAFYNTTLAQFDPSQRRLINPHYYKVDISDDLYNMNMEILDRLNKEIEEFTL